jgi:hypothetical protein
LRIDELPALDSDPLAPEQIFTNLVDDALKYRRDDAAVAAPWQQNGGRVKTGPWHEQPDFTNSAGAIDYLFGPDGTGAANRGKPLFGVARPVHITKPVNQENFADAIRQFGLFFSVRAGQAWAWARRYRSRHRSPPPTMCKRSRTTNILKGCSRTCAARPKAVSPSSLWMPSRYRFHPIMPSRSA